MRHWLFRAGCLLVFRGAFAQDLPPSSFINFETAPVHPVALGPDGRTLAVCNLPAGRLELFDVSSGTPLPLAHVPVGVDPVSVRFRTTNEVWVINHISASVSIVDAARRHVVATVQTRAGPADVTFAGSPARAFITCARENTVQVFNPTNRQWVTNLVIDGDRPKALAVSPDGAKVYAAIFESGNASTILAGRAALEHPRGPYGGQFPVPNDGLSLNPPLYINTNAEPDFYDGFMPVSLIVKKNPAGRWMDDNAGDWTEFISGTNSMLEDRGGLLGRPAGWDMPDRDLAVIDTTNFEVTYATGLMNICMDVAVNPVSGRIAVIGTDATNERRFEPNLRGTFVRVNLALVDPATLTRSLRDLNPHLDYSTPSVPQAARDQSIGDPRGIVWNAAGTRAYVTGMGSRNLVIIDGDGNRVHAQPVELEEGPTGMALDEVRNRLYIWNRFSSSLSTMDTLSLTVVTNLAVPDPTPAVIKVGRKHLYDTRRNSGLGQVSCASCHVDGRFDRLAWDLGNPASDIANLPIGRFHPMKGPLVTQTFQDIIGSEPLHWRGDRAGIEGFNVTFTDLLGADALISTNAMQEFKDFLATIHFPPNHYRNFDNSLPTDVPLPGLVGVDERGLPGGSNLPRGNAVRGRDVFMASCISCHQIQTGRGDGGDDVLVVRDARPLKVAQLRNLGDKLGMDTVGGSSRAGFGFRFDGRDDSLVRFFIDTEIFTGTEGSSLPLNQQFADMTAFLLAFSGSELQRRRDGGRGFPSKDAPAAVGRQVTLNSASSNALATAMIALADSPASGVNLMARGVQSDVRRSWLYERASGRFQSDRNGEDIATADLLALAAKGQELTLTVVLERCGRRLAIDRDEDGYHDRTEVELGLDPDDPLARGSNAPPRLQPVKSIAVHPGMRVSVTLTAADPDPDESQVFTILRELPEGASFEPATAQFTWVPTLAQSDRTYRIGVRVTDSGIPSLGDALAFDIDVVTLRITRFYRGPPYHYSDFTFETVPGGVVYWLQYKNDWDDPQWNNLSIHESFAREGQVWDQDSEFRPHRFYRIVHQ